MARSESLTHLSRPKGNASAEGLAILIPVTRGDKLRFRCAKWRYPGSLVWRIG